MGAVKRAESNAIDLIDNVHRLVHMEHKRFAQEGARADQLLKIQL